MPQKDPIFTKRTKQFTIRIPLISDRQNVFLTIFFTFITFICGGIYMYRIITSYHSNLLQIIISIAVILFIMLAPLYALIHIQKPDKID